MSRELPAKPNLEHLREQAKELLRRVQQNDTVAVELQLRVTGMAELRQTLRGKVVGVLFGPYPQ